MALAKVATEGVPLKSLTGVNATGLYTDVTLGESMLFERSLKVEAGLTLSKRRAEI